MKNLLRPQSFKEFIGQEKFKKTLKVIIESAKTRKKPVDHILLHGKAGIGKTSLATIIANEMGSRIRYAQGPTLEKKADILTIFASVQKNEVIFIDEVHGINRNIEEMIYSILEDGVIDLIVGPDGDSKIVRMTLPPFTFIGATTKIGSLSTPFKDRFGIQGKLLAYADEELSKIIKLSAKKLKWKIDEQAAFVIAKHARETPRLANNILKRCIDFATVDHIKIIDVKIVNKTFEAIGMYKLGLNESHLIYLKALSEIFECKSASLDSIMGVINETRENVETDIEPILMKYNLIAKTSRGRKITTKGVNYLTTYNLKARKTNG